MNVTAQRVIYRMGKTPKLADSWIAKREQAAELIDTGFLVWVQLLKTLPLCIFRINKP